MAYTVTDYKTKKQLKEDLKAGKEITVYQPDPMGMGIKAPVNGTVYREGPHYPKPHTWYAQGEMKDGKLVSVK